MPYRSLQSLGRVLGGNRRRRDVSRLAIRATFAKIAADPLHDPLGGMAVPIGIPRRRHGAIGSLIRKQPRDVPDNSPRVRARKKSGAGDYAFGALGAIAH